MLFNVLIPNAWMLNKAFVLFSPLTIVLIVQMEDLYVHNAIEEGILQLIMIYVIVLVPQTNVIQMAHNNACIL